VEHANTNGIFGLIDHDLIFGNTFNNEVKMNHIITITKRSSG